jgi:hypothetical protein
MSTADSVSLRTCNDPVTITESNTLTSYSTIKALAELANRGCACAAERLAGHLAEQEFKSALFCLRYWPSQETHPIHGSKIWVSSHITHAFTYTSVKEFYEWLKEWPADFVYKKKAVEEELGLLAFAVFGVDAPNMLTAQNVFPLPQILIDFKDPDKPAYQYFRGGWFGEVSPEQKPRAEIVLRLFLKLRTELLEEAGLSWPNEVPLPLMWDGTTEQLQGLYAGLIEHELIDCDEYIFQCIFGEKSTVPLVQWNESAGLFTYFINKLTEKFSRRNRARPWAFASERFLNKEGNQFTNKGLINTFDQTKRYENGKEYNRRRVVISDGKPIGYEKIDSIFQALDSLK